MRFTVDINIIYTMEASTSFSAENRDIEKVRTFVDQTTSEAADLRNKFERQEELVEAFGEEVNAPGAKLAHARADKLETRLIAAMGRQDAAYNRSVATVELVNTTTAVVSKNAAGKRKEAAKIKDGNLLKRNVVNAQLHKHKQGKVTQTSV